MDQNREMDIGGIMERWMNKGEEVASMEILTLTSWVYHCLTYWVRIPGLMLTTILS